jgi:farnesyl-diphosphate farnesyltransferase
MGTDHGQICRDILPKVSRSFAFCIARLPSALADQMTVSYLVFRVIDTIEDSSAPFETKEKGFAEFLGLLRNKPADEKVVNAHREFLLKSIDHDYERPLLENVESVLEAYHGFGEKVRQAILETAQEMARGMGEFQKRGITDFKAQDEYCHYVAGVVGHLNTRLFHLHGAIDQGLRDELMDLSNNFGLALQKVNVLRDVAHDLPRGRFYWPADVIKKHGLTNQTLCAPENRASALGVLDEMVKNALPYLDDAVEYVSRLPRTEVRIRVFCLIPLFMAFESLALCAGNGDVFDRGKLVKISRSDVRKIAIKSFFLSLSNGAIRRWHDECSASINKKFATGGGARELELTLYSKPDCHLCEEMERALENAARGMPVRLRRVDITTDPSLEKLYAMDIPLLTHGEERLARHRADERTLSAKLKKIASARG